MKSAKPTIALGTWSWGVGGAGGDQVFGNRLFEEELKPVYDRAMALGLNLWDTAAVYGDTTSERILGNLAKGTPREDIIFSTKFTPDIADGTPNAVQHMLDGSKARLYTDVIDVYWIHNAMDVERWTPDIVRVFKSGQVKSVGVSNHNLAQIKRVEEILGAEGIKLSAIQNHFSLMHRFSERTGILEHCKERGMDFYAYMTLEQGALSGAYSAENPLPAGSWRADVYNAHWAEIAPLNAALSSVGAAHGATGAQVAVAWALSKGALPIVGVTKAEHVDAAFGATKLELSDDEIALLERAGDTVGIATLRPWEAKMV